MKGIMCRVVSAAMTSMHFAMSDIVFQTNDDALQMYFIKDGHFDYTTQDGSVLNPPLRVSAWISEPVLWTHWRHRGEFKAIQPSELLSLSPVAFAEVLQHYPRAWLTGKCYGTYFVELINDFGMNMLSDVFFPGDWFSDMVETMGWNKKDDSRDTVHETVTALRKTRKV